MWGILRRGAPTRICVYGDEGGEFSVIYLPQFNPMLWLAVVADLKEDLLRRGEEGGASSRLRSAMILV